MLVRAQDQALVRMSQLRRRRRIRRLCAEPGCPTVSGETFRCAAHAAEYARRSREFRKRRAQLKEMLRKASKGPGRY